MIEVTLDTECPKGTEEAVSAAAQGVLQFEQAEGWLSVLVTDDGTIHEMNRDYRGIDRPTDVLSFPTRDGDSLPGAPDGFLGDIAISMDRAKAQAEEYGHSLKRELCFLTVHGTLHLLGYDHMEEEQKLQMFQRQEQILLSMGITR